MLENKKTTSCSHLYISFTYEEAVKQVIFQKLIKVEMEIFHFLQECLLFWSHQPTW